MSREEKPAPFFDLPPSRFLEDLRSGVGRHGLARPDCRPQLCRRGQHDQDGPGRLRRPRHRGRGQGPEHQGPDEALGHGRLLREPAPVQPPGTCPSSSASRWTCPRSGSSSAWTPTRRPSTRSAPGGVVLLATPPAFRPDPRGIRRGQGLPRVHGEVVRRRRPGHSPRARRRARRPRRRTSRSPAG